VLTGYLWPAYQTYKAVAVSNKEDLRTWAIYWWVLQPWVVTGYVSNLSAKLINCPALLVEMQACHGSLSVG
jgi:hypothetical protein